MSDPHDPYAPPLDTEAPRATEPAVPPGVRASPPPAALRPVGRVRVNGLAIASLVAGSLFVTAVGAVLALAFGYAALGQIAEAPTAWHPASRRVATAGIVLGWIGAVCALLFLAFGVWLVVQVAMIPYG